MEKLKRYPKMALASLALLIVTLLMFFMDWITVKQPSLITMLTSYIPVLSDGSLSFVEGLSLMGSLNDLSNGVSQLLGQNNLSSLITVLSIAYHILFWGSILAVIYCFYARVKWHSGLREGIYFLFFIGDTILMYMLMEQLNTLCGAGTFGLTPWGIFAVVCALLSEILWEEVSFNTPNPLQDVTK